MVFARGVVSKKGRFEQFLQFSPNGDRLTFAVTNGDWSAFSLRVLKMEDGHWSKPVTPPYMGDNPGAVTSCVSFDESRAFFTSARPSYPPCDIWMSRHGKTGWSDPVNLGPPISTKADEFEVVVSRNGSLYFSSNRQGGHGDMDIYRARCVEGEYPVAENLGPPINTSSGDDLPCIAPDESYLIFASDRPGGLGNRDLYISFQTESGWTEAKNLGTPINSEAFDIYPTLSPDGKYLFFTRRKSWRCTEDSDIYWVSAGFISRLWAAADK